MANTTQDQQKNASEENVVNEETQVLQQENGESQEVTVEAKVEEKEKVTECEDQDEIKSNKEGENEVGVEKNNIKSEEGQSQKLDTGDNSENNVGEINKGVDAEAGVGSNINDKVDGEGDADGCNVSKKTDGGADSKVDDEVHDEIHGKPDDGDDAGVGCSGSDKVDGGVDSKVDDKIDDNDDDDDDDNDDDVEVEVEGEGDIEHEDDEVEDEDVPDTKAETQLDHDQDRRNPQYIPKGGAFYEHDNRTSLGDVENKDPQEIDKKKKVWKESKEAERWLHDWYKESEQQPKTKAEILETYGYDIRNEEAPPRARRRRKYGRGPDKYDRNWEDEQAYMMKQNSAGRRGKKKSFGKDEFPPLPNRKSDSNIQKTPPKSPGWKKEEESIRKPQKVNNSLEKPSGLHQNNKTDYSATRNGVNSIVSNKRNVSQSKNIVRDEVKPFRQYDRTKWKNNNFRRGKPEEGLKSSKIKSTNQGESQTHRSVETNKNYGAGSDISHVTEGFSQMTFHNKHSNTRDNRQESNEVSEQELDSPANRLNPKRYSKNRKGFTGFFPPEEIVEINPADMKQLQQEQQQKSQHVNLQQQPLNIQNVIRRYPGNYNGNPGYLAPRHIITGIPQQGMSPQGLQQALSPQGIPQQALSPQVPGLQPIDLQQGPIPAQPNFVSQMYIGMDPSTWTSSDTMGPYTGYAPYSANQPSEMYQPPGGITYYNTECQNSNQIRAPLTRREKAAIPILPPPE
ncbi:hypothetical protein RUM43_001201 [Polyplax serrata]|uniref:Protein CASC3 n=1 Tax=Polyplax serrata TaxID=468196 RepID=A0AAN8SDM9_POLSC